MISGKDPIKNRKIRVLGIDPGIATTGLGIVERNLEEKNQKLGLIKTGIIKTDKNLPYPTRLLLIHKGISEIIKKFMPDCVAVEDVFFFKNTKTAIKIGEIKGVITLSCSLLDIDVHTYTPLEIKQALTGFGRGTKHQVQEMVKRLLGLKEVPKPDDASDAIACAICHIQSLWTESI
ncbi:TPA: crossover junction endodeoxyribonuclease RuvC [bacterium]|nr:crossover junction endodeoxyribonuclease RuvC [bacterium]